MEKNYDNGILVGISLGIILTISVAFLLYGLTAGSQKSNIDNSVVTKCFDIAENGSISEKSCSK